MSKEYKNIFEEEIVVPEIVQLKTEEALTQIKQKGTNDSMKEHDIIPMKPKSPKKSKILKICVAVCACFALFISASHFNNVLNVGGKNIGSNSVQNTENSNIVENLTNMFTIQVYAADSPYASQDGYVTLEPGKSVITGNQAGYVLCENEEGNVTYCVGTRFLCEGENIESITYEIENAAFQIVESEDSSIITSFEEYGTLLNTGSVGGGGVKEERPGEYEEYEYVTTIGFYKLYTLDYDKQSDDETWINICNVTDIPWESSLGNCDTMEEKANCMDDMMKDVRIICTVHYSDGTTDSGTIRVGGAVITPEMTEEPEKHITHAGFEFRYEE